MARWLHLVRHGVGANAVPGTFLGTSDPPLSPAGEAQARTLGELLVGLRCGRAFASPLVRARRTAELALPQLPATVWPDLREVDFGSWEGQTFAAVAAAAPELVRQWHDFAPDFGFPDGERLDAFHVRVAAAAAALAADPAESVIAFTHGGVMRALLCHFLGLPLRQYLIFRPDYGALTTLELFGERGVLTGLNLVPLAAAGHG